MTDIEHAQSMFGSKSLPRMTPIVRLLLPDAQPLITFLQRLDRADEVQLYTMLETRILLYSLYSIHSTVSWRFNLCFCARTAFYQTAKLFSLINLLKTNV